MTLSRGLVSLVRGSKEVEFFGDKKQRSGIFGDRKQMSGIFGDTK